MKAIRIVQLIFTIAISVLIFACSLDRTKILPEKKQVDQNDIKNKKFVSSTISANDLMPTSLKKTINSTSDLPFRGPKGSLIYLEASDLKTSAGGAVSYPFEIELIEALVPGDMILFGKSTESFGRILSSGGEIYIKASKNGAALQAKYAYEISIPAKTFDSDMSVFVGGLNKEEQFTWLQSPRDTIRLTKNKEGIYFKMFPNTLGWINCDKFYKFEGEKTRVNFTSKSPSIAEMTIFIVLKDINSVIEVFNGVSLEMPVGQDITVVAFAETESKEWFSFISDIKNISPNQSIEISLEATTKDKLKEDLSKL